MKIVCFSDTHGFHQYVTIPHGDLLLFGGDMCRYSTINEVKSFNNWLGTLGYPPERIVVIAGNHDSPFEDDASNARRFMTNCVYLEDSGYSIDGLNVWGSPWQPFFCNWAFNLGTQEELAEKWALIPERTDILITHGPSYQYGDKTARGERVGCKELSKAIERVKPKMHLFGHIHEDYGVFMKDETFCVNASTCNLRYQPIHPPIIFEYLNGQLNLSNMI